MPATAQSAAQKLKAAAEQALHGKFDQASAQKALEKLQQDTAETVDDLFSTTKGKKDKSAKDKKDKKQKKEKKEKDGKDTTEKDGKEKKEKDGKDKKEKDGKEKKEKDGKDKKEKDGKEKKEKDGKEKDTKSASKDQEVSTSSKQQTEAAAKEPMASGSASSSKPSDAPEPEASASASGAASSKESSKSSKESKNCTYLFTQIADIPEPQKIETAREIFVSSNLVLPAIALKKAKQAFDSYGDATPNFLGVMGAAKIKMYKIIRPGVEKLVMGDYGKDKDLFWKEVRKHLGSCPVQVILLTNNSSFTVSQVARLRCCRGLSGS